MANPLLIPEIRTMLVEGDDAGLKEVMTELHPASTAEFAEGLLVEETWKLLEHADVHRQAEVFAFFPPEKQVALVAGVGREKMSELLEAMSHDDRVDLLQLLDDDLVDTLLPLVARADREDIRRLLSYPGDSAGAVMTTDYATLPPDITVQEAIHRVRQQAPQKETIYYIYVVDDQRHLVGFVSLRDLIVAKPSAVIHDIMQEEVVTVRVDQDQEEVARELAKFDFIAVPVVDNENRILGIITHDDVLDVLEEEATEDAFHMAAVGTMEENYLDARFATVWRKRSLWLSCLFVAQLFTFTVMAQYEHAIASIIALSLFLPLCISTGGNSGSQAATLITRAMALEQVSPGEWRRVFRHELLMGAVLGITLGAIGFLRAALTPESMLRTADGDILQSWLLGVVIGSSVALICLWGTLVGSMLPLAFKRLGFDPGYASTPFVATIVDVTGIAIYFSIASWCLL